MPRAQRRRASHIRSCTTRARASYMGSKMSWHIFTSFMNVAQISALLAAQAQLSLERARGAWVERLVGCDERVARKVSGLVVGSGVAGA